MAKTKILAIAFMVSCTVQMPAMRYNVILDAQEINKFGRATCTTIFGFLRFGDCSIHTAMVNGDVRHVHHVDTEETNYIIAKKVTTLVYGEGKRAYPEDNHEISRPEVMYDKLIIGDIYDFHRTDNISRKGLLDQIGESVLVIVNDEGRREVLPKKSLSRVEPSSFDR